MKKKQRQRPRQRRFVTPGAGGLHPAHKSYKRKKKKLVGKLIKLYREVVMAHAWPQHC